MKKILFPALSFVITMSCQEPEVPQNPAERIIVEASLEGDWLNRSVAHTGLEDKLELKYMSTRSVYFKPPYHSVKGKIAGGKANWTFYSSEPVRAFFIPGVLKLLCPGDSIHLNLQGSKAFYTGKGAEKINLWERVKWEGERLSTPTNASFRIASIEDYLNWDRYAYNKAKSQMSLINSFRDKITEADYEYLKAEVISMTELDRLNAFEDLLSEYAKQKLLDISTVNLCAIWDSTQYRTEGKWLRSLSVFHGSIYVITLFNEMEVQRRFGFDGKNDSLRSRGNRNYLYYMAAKKNYIGLLRERLIGYILTQDVIPKMDTGNPMREWIIKDYYTQPGFHEFKQMIKDVQKKQK